MVLSGLNDILNNVTNYKSMAFTLLVQVYTELGILKYIRGFLSYFWKGTEFLKY